MSAKITKRYLDYNGLQYLIEKIKKGIPFILKPTLTNQYDLGQTGKQWKNIYGENVYQNQKQVVDTIKMNGSTTALTNTNGTVVIPTVAGPQGPTGEQGPVGPAAGFGTPTATTTVLADNTDPTVSVTASGSNTDKVFAFTFGLPKGYQGATGLQGVQGATGPRGVQGATGGAGFIASVDKQNFTKANWETYGTVGHQENWSNTTIPAEMIPGDLFVVTGCATDTGDGYQLVYKYDPTFQPTNTTLRGTCISSHVIARHSQLGTANAGTNISIANNKINAEGYVYDSTKKSFAECIRSTASGNYSHAEGYNTTASGYYSHAEGYNTKASGQASHAEGIFTTASGVYSHAEGASTTVSGSHSHAEGNHTTAYGYSQHVEGLYTIGATGANAQHVSGMYNETDDNALFIIGNGTDVSARSNAMVVGSTGLMKIGSIQANKTTDQASDKYFATDGSIQSISASSGGENCLPYNISISAGNDNAQCCQLDINTHTFTQTQDPIETIGVFEWTTISPNISCKTDLTAEQLTQKYKNCFLCHLVQRRKGDFVYWRIVDSTFETYPLWLPKKLTGGTENLQFGYVKDLMNQACKFTTATVDDALLKCMFFGSQNEKIDSWHHAGSLKNFINYGTDNRYIQFRGMERTLNERNEMREIETQRDEVNAENILHQYSNGYSINVKMAIFGTADNAITNNTTDAVLLSNVISGKYYIKKVTKSPKSFAFGFAEEP